MRHWSTSNEVILGWLVPHADWLLHTEQVNYIREQRAAFYGCASDGK